MVDLSAYYVCNSFRHLVCISQTTAAPGAGTTLLRCYAVTRYGDAGTDHRRQYCTWRRVWWIFAIVSFPLFPLNSACNWGDQALTQMHLVLFAYIERQSRKSMPNTQTVQRFLPMQCGCVSTTVENTEGCCVGDFHTGRSWVWDVRSVFPDFLADTDIVRKDETAWAFKVEEDMLCPRTYWNRGAWEGGEYRLFGLQVWTSTFLQF